MNYYTEVSQYDVERLGQYLKNLFQNCLFGVICTLVLGLRVGFSYKKKIKIKTKKQNLSVNYLFFFLK